MTTGRRTGFADVSYNQVWEQVVGPLTVTTEHNSSASGDAGRFASLVPQLAVEMAAQPGNHHQQIDGSMLSADISGFTALSEKLAGKGKAGAEEITQLINICFTELIDAAYAYGGEVIKFGGDALLVLFRGDDHLTRVAAAGLDMQDALHSSPAAKKAKLTMTVGAAEGPFEAFLVGDQHRELILSGPNASHVIHLEGEADKGDTVVSTGIADALPDALRVREHAGGWVISGQVDQEKTGPAERSTDGASLDGLVPAAVEAHFEGFAELGGEHRIVSVAFLSVTGVDEHLEDHGTAQTRDALAELIDAVSLACDEFGVTPLHTDIAPNGLKFILCAGAPFTRGNTSEAILEASLRITKFSTPFTLKVGVQRGRAFAGFLGSPFRRTYTLMGDAVNTAARMLGKAANRDVVAVNEVLADTRTIYASEEIEPFLVKGKTEPMHASYVFGTTDWVQRQAPAAPLIGRDTELAALFEALESGGRAVQLVGPAGSGKTRLLDEFRAEASRRMIHRIEAHCSPYSASTPYALLEIVLRRTAEIEANADSITAGELLYKAVRHHEPDLLPMLPILAIPAGADVEPTEEASAIDAKFLRDRIHDVSARFVRSVLDENVIFILEDVQWIDDASADFLEFALTHRTSDRWTALVSFREDGNWSADSEASDRTIIRLDPLANDDVRELVIEASTTDLPDTVLDRIVPQALGNPLFALELTKAIESSDNEDIPDSVEQLVATRLDALNADERHILRVASVFGTHFDRSDLDAVIDTEAVDLSGLGEFLGDAGRQRFEFNNALFRDVAYEGLPFEHRKRLHLRVGERLESIHTDPNTISSLLASHFSMAGEHQKTWPYGVHAGDKAAAQAANVEAAASYELALDAGKRLRMRTPEMSRVALALGDAEARVGRLDRSEQAYTLARKTTAELSERLRAMLRIGGLREQQGRLSQAASWYSRVERTLREETSPGDQLAVWSDMHHRRSGVHHRNGDQQACIDEARKALGAAEDIDDVEAMAEALQRLHLATIYLGRPDRIGYGPSALRLFERLGRAERQSAVHNNLGIEHYFNARWDEAVAAYRAAVTSGLRAGSVIDGLLGNLNAGEILSDQGHWDEALEILRDTRRNWDGGRYPTGLAYAQLFIGVTHSRMGQLAEAERYLLLAEQGGEALKLKDLQLTARLRRAEAVLGSGTDIVSDIAKMNVDHPETMQQLGNLERRVRCTAFATRGEFSAVQDEMLQAVEDTSGYERGLHLRILQTYGRGETSAWEIEANAIFEDLGVVRLRPLPDVSA
jgi:class 3 adenylate cyclase/tetratricopeptide (TPR) repeat protein